MIVALKLHDRIRIETVEAIVGELLTLRGNKVFLVVTSTEKASDGILRSAARKLESILPLASAGWLTPSGVFTECAPAVTEAPPSATHFSHLSEIA